MASVFCNVGPVERIVRLLAAGAAAVPVLNRRQPENFRKWLAIASVAEVVTAYTRFCPLNLLLRINNCHRHGMLGAAVSALPGAGLASGAVERMRSAGSGGAGAAGEMVSNAASNVASGVASGASMAAAGGASVLGALAASEEDDDEPGDNFSVLIAGVGALAIAAGFTFALNSTRTARVAAARSTVRTDGRQPAVQSLGTTLQGAINSPTGESSNAPS